MKNILTMPFTAVARIGQITRNAARGLLQSSNVSPLAAFVARRPGRFSPSTSSASNRAGAGELSRVLNTGGRWLYDVEQVPLQPDGIARYRLIYRHANNRRLAPGTPVTVTARGVLAAPPYSPFSSDWVLVSSSPLGSGIMRASDVSLGQVQIR